MSKKFDEHIQPGDEVIYNEDLGCRVNLSQLKRVAKKSDYVKADYCSKELCLLLRKKGIEASHIMRFEKGGSWYNRYTLDVACKWLREVHNLFIGVGFGNDDKGNFLYMADIYNLKNDAVEGRYIPIVEADAYLNSNPKTYEEAVSIAIEYCLNNLIKT